MSSDPDPENNAGSVTAQAQASADLVMIKWALFRQLGAGGTAVFFLTVVNLGPSAAAEVGVSDTFPAGLTPTAVSNPACSLTGQVVACAYPALGPGESRTAMVTATVGADVAPGDLVNTASATTATPDPVSENDTDQAAVTVVAVADLAVAKSADPAEAAPGDEVTFGLVVTNAGPSGADDVTLSDELSAGLTVRSVDAGAPFVCDTAGRRVTCTAETLPVGEYAVAVVAVLAEGASGSLVNTVRVDSPTLDPDPGNNEASATVTVTEDDGGGGGGGGGGGELPQTGGGSWPLGYAIGAIVLTAAGAALLGRSAAPDRELTAGPPAPATQEALARQWASAGGGRGGIRDPARVGGSVRPAYHYAGFPTPRWRARCTASTLPSPRSDEPRRPRRR